MANTADGTSNFMRFQYRDSDGKLLFEHNRFVPKDGKRIVYYRWNPVAYWGGGRPKREHWVNHKPEKGKGDPFDADDYLFRLPEVLAGIDAGSAVWWTEGERDALALVRKGVVATSHHGGAGKVFAEQCEWLEDAREIVLCLDRDPPGAFDGLLRWRGLVEECGVDPACIRVVYTPIRDCKDVRDHLTLGFRLDQMSEMSIPDLRQEAKKYNPQSAQRAGYAYVRSSKRGA